MKKNKLVKLSVITLIIGIGFSLGLFFKRIRAAFVAPINENQFIVKKWGKQCVDQNQSGDLWLYSNNGDNPKQITKKQCIDKVLALSPNRKNALVTTTSFNNGSRKTLLAVVELATGMTKILRDGDQYHNYGIGYWLSDKEVVNFIPTNENTIKIEAINFQNKDSKIVGEWPTGVLFSGNKPFSENKQWAVGNSYQTEGPFTVKLFSYDLISKTKQSIIDGKFIKFVTWSGDKIIYLDKVGGKNTIWMIDANGVNKEKLGDLDGGEISNFAVSGDHKKLIYSVVTKKTNTPEIDVVHNWFSFDLINKENKKINFNESFVVIQSLNEQGNLGTFEKKDTRELFLVNLNTLISIKLCGAGNGCEVIFP